jgi:hypothetical protein
VDAVSALLRLVHTASARPLPLLPLGRAALVTDRAQDTEAIRAAQAAAVEKRIAALESVGKRGRLPAFWRTPLALAFAADEVGAAEMLARLEADERALLEYGVHKIRCAVTEDIGRGGDGEVPCTCGFTEASDRAALAAAAPGETEQTP